MNQPIGLDIVIPVVRNIKLLDIKKNIVMCFVCITIVVFCLPSCVGSVVMN